MKIFLLEDDLFLAKTIKNSLKNIYVIEHATDTVEAEKLFDENEYDLFIVDLSLPRGSGIDFCKYIRKSKCLSPVLILTGNMEISQKVEAFECGADDYLLKPFHFDELLARIRALLRRPQTYVTSTLSIDDLLIDVHKRVAYRSSQNIYLRPKEFNILEFLIRNKGLVVTRNMILNHLWDNSYESFTNIVDVHIKHLRDRVDKPFKKKLIQTVHGLGYKIEG